MRRLLGNCLEPLFIIFNNFLNVNIMGRPKVGDKIEVGWNVDSCVILI
jgi:hypothetical protein